MDNIFPTTHYSILLGWQATLQSNVFLYESNSIITPLNSFIFIGVTTSLLSLCAPVASCHENTWIWHNVKGDSVTWLHNNNLTSTQFENLLHVLTTLVAQGTENVTEDCAHWSKDQSYNGSVLWACWAFSSMDLGVKKVSIIYIYIFIHIFQH